MSQIGLNESIEEKKKLYPTIELLCLVQLWPSYIALSWNKKLVNGLNTITNERLVKQGLNQNNELSIIWVH